MQACIELLDPEAIALNLQKSLEDMWQLQDVDPSTLPTEESVLMSKRSAQFLKFAAKELKVKEIFDALAVDNLNILTCSENEMETVFQKAIYRVKERSIAREEYERWTESEWLNAYKKLYSLGWCTDVWDYSFKPIPFIDWMNYHGPLALKLLKGNTENPAARQEIENELNRQNRPTDLVNKLKGKNLGEQVAFIRLAAQNSISTSATSSELKDIETLAQKLGFNSIDKKTGEILYEALQLFGKKAFDKCSLAKGVQ